MKAPSKSLANPALDARQPSRRNVRQKLPSLRAFCIALAASTSLGFTPVSAQVFVREITPGDLADDVGFGQSIAANATHIAVGSPQDSTRGPASGAVHIFSSATGAQVRKLFVPATEAGDTDAFGGAVAVAGNLLAVGAPSADAGGSGHGAVYLFNLATGALLRTIVDPTGTDSDGFATSVAMAGDLLIIGARHRDAPGPVPVPDAGAIFIFNLRTAVLSDPIMASAPESDAQFGYAVAVEGGLIAVGAPGESDGGDDQGAAYLVDAQTGAEIHRFSAGDGANFNYFGYSVALARQRLIVGAPNKSSNSGKAYAYDTVSFGEVWAVDGTAADEFQGIALGASGDLIAIAATGFAFPGAPNAGRVQVFQSRDGNLVETLSAPGPIENDSFGTAVAVSGVTMLATAPGRDNPVLLPGANHGAAFKCAPIRSPLPFTEVAIKGSTPPVAPNTTFLAFNQLAVSPGGFTAFDANLIGSGATLGKNSGIWTDGNFAMPDVLQLVRRTGLSLNTTPATAHKGVDFTNPVSNVNGLLGFTARTSGTGITTLQDSVFAVWNGTSLTIPMREDLSVAGGPVKSFAPPRQNSLGFLSTFTLRTGGGIEANEDSGLVHFNSGGILSSITEGETPSGGLPLPYGQFMQRVAAPISPATYATFLQFTPASNNLALFTNGNDLARKGFPALNAAGANFGTFSNFLAETNGDASSFFRASIIPPANSPGKNQGIWSNRTGGDPRVALLKGEFYTGPTPGFGLPSLGLPPGVTIKSFLRFAVNDNPDLLAWVLLQGPGVTTANDGAILLSRHTGSEPSPVEILLREGLPAPGCGRARIGTIQALDFETNSSYVVLASLLVESGGATLTDNQALFLSNTQAGISDHPSLRQPRLMLRKGMQFLRAGSPIVKSISLPGYLMDASGAMNTGLAHLVSSLGSLPTCSAVVTFNDGQTSVMSIFP